MSPWWQSLVEEVITQSVQTFEQANKELSPTSALVLFSEYCARSTSAPEGTLPARADDSRARSLAPNVYPRASCRIGETGGRKAA